MGLYSTCLLSIRISPACQNKSYDYSELVALLMFMLVGGATKPQSSEYGCQSCLLSASTTFQSNDVVYMFNVSVIMHTVMVQLEVPGRLIK